MSLRSSSVVIRLVLSSLQPPPRTTVSDRVVLRGSPGRGAARLPGIVALGPTRGDPRPVLLVRAQLPRMPTIGDYCRLVPTIAEYCRLASTHPGEPLASRARLQGGT